MKKILKKLSLIILILASFAVIFVAKAKTWHDQETNYYLASVKAGFVPKGEDLKKITFGYDNFIADIYWLKAIQFSGANARSLQFDALYEYLDLITDLDQKFQAPYIHAARFLPLANQTEKAIVLLEKGEKNLPNDWEIPWNKAFLEYYYLDDYEGAIASYEQCLKLPGCLEGAEKTIANLRAKIGKYEIALQEWLRIYSDENTDPATRNLAELKIEEAGKLLALNNALKFYEEKNNNNQPASLDDLKTFYQQLPIAQKTELSTVFMAINKQFSNMNANIFLNSFENNPFIYDQEKNLIRTEK